MPDPAPVTATTFPAIRPAMPPPLARAPTREERSRPRAGLYRRLSRPTAEARRGRAEDRWTPWDPPDNVGAKSGEDGDANGDPGVPIGPRVAGTLARRRGLRDHAAGEDRRGELLPL